MTVCSHKKQTQHPHPITDTYIVYSEQKRSPFDTTVHVLIITNIPVNTTVS
jgi:hypothetical protein